MKFKTNFMYKPGNFQMDDCQIEKVVELTPNEFAKLRITPLEDQSFIVGNRHFMFSRDSVMHCLLALGQGSHDGVLVMSDGYDYPRYAAFVPGMRDIVSAELDRAVEYIVQRGIENTGNGNWIVGFDELKETFGLTIRPGNGLDTILLEKMADRKEVADVVLTCDGVDTVYCLAYCKNLEEALPLELSTGRKAFLFDCGVGALRDLCKPDELYTLLHDSFGLTLAEIGDCDYLGDHYLQSIGDVARRVMYDQMDTRELLQMEGLPHDTYLMNDQRNCRFPLDGAKRLEGRGTVDLGALLDARVIDIRKAPNGTTNVILSGVTAEEMSRLSHEIETLDREGPAMKQTF